MYVIHVQSNPTDSRYVAISSAPNSVYGTGCDKVSAIDSARRLLVEAAATDRLKPNIHELERACIAMGLDPDPVLTAAYGA